MFTSVHCTPSLINTIVFADALVLIDLGRNQSTFNQHLVTTLVLTAVAVAEPL